ncbi:MAG: hypothetical protein JNM78_04580 [Cyclobacteriaceae bacterium]|nr:hypothetical protein [Cyclobacteriaceae bacterium]
MANEIESSLFSTNKIPTFIILCLLTLLLLYIKISFIEQETAAFEFLQDRPEGTVLKMISALQFFSIPLIYLWKFTVIGFVIWVGSFMFGFRITFSQCWSVVMAAEFIFLIPEFLKIVWFMFIETDPTLPQIKAFYPFSLINLVDYTAIAKRYAYPLKAISIFEFFYVLVLVNGVHHYARRDKRAAWWIVSASYILIFLLWLLFYIIVYK